MSSLNSNRGSIYTVCTCSRLRICDLTAYTLDVRFAWQVTIWGDYGRMEGKKVFMGVAQIMLDDLDLSNIVIGWYKLFGTSSLVSMPPNGPPPNQGPGTTGPPNSTCPLPNNPGRVKTPTMATSSAAADELAQQQDGGGGGGGGSGGGGESVVGSFDDGSFG